MSNWGKHTKYLGFLSRYLFDKKVKGLRKTKNKQKKIPQLIDADNIMGITRGKQGGED